MCNKHCSKKKTTFANTVLCAMVGVSVAIGSAILGACFILFLLVASCSKAEAAVITPFFEAGAAHRDCDLTDRMLCTNDNMGSNTPGYLGAGVEISDCSYFLGADTCTIQWIHQSYVDRGEPFNDSPEAQMDSYGMMFRWKIESWSFEL